MPSNQTLRLLNITLFTFSVGLVLFFSGCAGHKSNVDQKMTLLEERLRELTHSLDDKDWEVRTLKNRLSELESQKVVKRAADATAKLEITKKKRAASARKKPEPEGYVVTDADFEDENRA